MARVRVSLQTGSPEPTTSLERSAPAQARLADVVCGARQRARGAVVCEPCPSAALEPPAGARSACDQSVSRSTATLRPRAAVRLSVLRPGDSCGDRAVAGARTGR